MQKLIFVGLAVLFFVSSGCSS